MVATVTRRYYQYLLLTDILALPYSFFQLIVKEKLEQKQQKKRVGVLSDFDLMMSTLATNAFSYQHRNNTLLHALSS